MNNIKVPPHNLEAEKAVLGAMLLKPDCISSVRELIEPVAFYRAANETICEAIFDLKEEADIVTVSQWLKDRDLLDKVGGLDYLSAVMDSVSTAASVKFHSNIVKNLYNKRKLIETCTITIEQSQNGDHRVSDILGDHNVRLAEIELSQESRVISMQDGLKDTIKNLETISSMDGLIGLPSGFPDIDNYTGGWMDGDIITVAGRPQSGKSVLAKDFAENSGVPTLVFNLEMSIQQTQFRQLADHAKINHEKIRTGKLSADDWEKILRACEELNEIPIFYVDIGLLNIHTISSIIDNWIKKVGIKLIVIDYLQLIGDPELVGKREQEVAAISRRLKATARHHNIPIINVAQVNRKVEDRSNHRPILSDLRESGAIEQDADIVAFLYREFLYNDKAPIHKAELILAKGRNIRTGTVPLFWDGAHQAFRNYVYEDEGDF